MSMRKGPLDKLRFPYTVVFSPEQHELLQRIVMGGTSFSELTEYALGSYIPHAFGSHDQPIVWPKAARLRRPNQRGKTSRTYGVLFTGAQHQVIQQVLSQSRLAFPQLMDRALDAYIERVFGEPWPAAARFSRTG